LPLPKHLSWYVHVLMAPGKAYICILPDKGKKWWLGDGFQMPGRWSWERYVTTTLTQLCRK